MIMYAEHIIGLLPKEHIASSPTEIAAASQSVRSRWEMIRQSGVLRPHGKLRAPGETGSTFPLDVMAGDSQYVFLSYGPRYRHAERHSDLCYGFAFDPVCLIEQCGALVGTDMMDTYDDIIDATATEIDATLPPKPQDAEGVAAFMTTFGEGDPKLRAYLLEASTSHYDDLCDAIRHNDPSGPGAAVAIQLFKERTAAAQRSMRKCGREAIALLSDAAAGELEILVPIQLPLSLCNGYIINGELL